MHIVHVTSVCFILYVSNVATLGVVCGRNDIDIFKVGNINLGKLKNIIKTEVEDYLDHKNLNLDIDDFKSSNPSAENIAVLIYNRLIPHFDDNYKLKITLYETPRNFVEYSG